MKTLVIGIVALFVLIIVAFYMLGVISKSGKAAGLIEGKLTQCPDKPNCVCSEHESSQQHYIEPILIPDDIKIKPLSVMQTALHNMQANIEFQDEAYMAATFTSKFFGFVDDVEIRFDEDARLIHIRSASRVGYSDADVNRKRVMQLKALYQDLLSSH